MRPVAAPYETLEAIGIAQQRQGRERDALAPVPVPVSTGKFHPDPAGLAAGQEIPETGVLDTQGRVRPAEMINHDLHTRFQEGLHDPGQPPRFGLYLNLPVEIRQGAEQRAPGSRVERRIGHADEIKSDPTIPVSSSSSS